MIDISSIKLVQDFVLVRVDPPKSHYESGLEIPEPDRERNYMGEVVAVGPGRRKFPVTVSVGQRVMWKPYDGENITIDGVEYVRLRNNDIVAEV